MWVQPSIVDPMRLLHGICSESKPTTWQTIHSRSVYPSSKPKYSLQVLRGKNFLINNQLTKSRSIFFNPIKHCKQVSDTYTSHCLLTSISICFPVFFSPGASIQGVWSELSEYCSYMRSVRSQCGIQHRWNTHLYHRPNTDDVNESSSIESYLDDQ